jgi:hypothetical protein
VGLPRESSTRILCDHRLQRSKRRLYLLFGTSCRHPSECIKQYRICSTDEIFRSIISFRRLRGLSIWATKSCSRAKGIEVTSLRDQRASINRMDSLMSGMSGMGMDMSSSSMFLPYNQALARGYWYIFAGVLAGFLVVRAIEYCQTWSRSVRFFDMKLP